MFTASNQLCRTGRWTLGGLRPSERAARADTQRGVGSLRPHLARTGAEFETSRVNDGGTSSKSPSRSPEAKPSVSTAQNPPTPTFQFKTTAKLSLTGGLPMHAQRNTKSSQNPFSARGAIKSRSVQAGLRPGPPAERQVALSEEEIERRAKEAEAQARKRTEAGRLFAGIV